ncbi:MAG: VWA domain-containing protein [Candidatus Riflebacteria bacterium]|nr:VWA domain-containing protein [Candidatus Riflebacteria bacterium]
MTSLFNTFKPTKSLSGLFSAEKEHPIPLKEVSLSGFQQGLAGEWSLKQTFQNSEDKNIEAVYLFPLPEESSVVGFKITTGENVIEGVIDERENAFGRYDNAIAKGDAAFLLDQERPNVFQISVGNIIQNQEVIIEIKFLLIAKTHGREIRILIPTIVFPRYDSESISRNDFRENERIRPQYDSSVTYGLKMDLTILMPSAISKLESPSHQISCKINGMKALVMLVEKSVVPDRDIVICLETSEAGLPSALAGSFKGRDHILLQLMPEFKNSCERKHRSIAFLIDCSGSMEGDSISEVRKAVELCLRSMKQNDVFQIVFFGSTFTSLFPKPVVLTQEILEEVSGIIRNIKADLGGTEILPALESLEEHFPDDKCDVILFTDGHVSNEKDILEWGVKNSHKCRVFSFGIGKGASEYLVNGLARTTNGATEFVFPGERLDTKVLRQFNRMNTPVLSDVKIDWGIEKDSLESCSIQPVFSEEVFLCVARLSIGTKLSEGSRIRLTGKTSNEAFAWEAKVTRIKNIRPAALYWARKKIQDIEEKTLKNEGSRQSDKVNSKLLRISREYGLISSVSSFIGVLKRACAEKTTEPCELRKVPVALTNDLIVRKLEDCRRRFSSEKIHFCMSIVGNNSPKQAEKIIIENPKIENKVVTAGKSALNCLYKTFFGNDLFKDKSISFDFSKNNNSETKDLPDFTSLLHEARLDGSFKLTSQLADLSGKTMEELKNMILQVRAHPGFDSEIVFATSLAVFLLQKHASEHEANWKKIVEKSLDWLSDKQVYAPDGSSLHIWLEKIFLKSVLSEGEANGS